VGEHDFTSFTTVDPERGKDDEERMSLHTIFQSEFLNENKQLMYHMQNNKFLHHMIRSLMGTFLLVGKETLATKSITKIIATKNRSLASPTAPASGLFLT